MIKISETPPHPIPPSTFFQNITLPWFSFYFSGQFSFATHLLYQHLVHQALVLGLPFFSFCTCKDVQFIYRVSIHYFPQQTTYILVSHLYLWARRLNSRRVYWLACSTALPGRLYSLPGWPSCPDLPRRGFLASWWSPPYPLPHVHSQKVSPSSISYSVVAEDTRNSFPYHSYPIFQNPTFTP